jgi:hypothetical protein
MRLHPRAARTETQARRQNKNNSFHTALPYAPILTHLAATEKCKNQTSVIGRLIAGPAANSQPG